MSFQGVIITILLLSTVVYGLLVLWQWWGWKSLSIAIQGTIELPTYTVIIAARNEESSISLVLNDILTQTYPPKEIIVVDDHSTDGTASVIRAMANSYPSIRLLSLQASHGKKAAVSLAISECTTPWVLFTDADCRLGKKWADVMLKRSISDGAVMTLGPVVLTGDGSLFQTIQQLEMNAIMGVTGGMVAHARPVMANGANYAIKREALENIPSNALQLGNPSGDDVFLMLELVRMGIGKVSFEKSFEAVVATSPKISLAEFIEQRKRWLSKKGGYSNLWVMITAWVTYFGNLGALVSLILLPWFGVYLGWALFFKFIPDLILIRAAQRDLQPACGVGIFLLAELFILVYVSLIGFIPTGIYVWKGRKVKVKNG